MQVLQITSMFLKWIILISQGLTVVPIPPSWISFWEQFKKILENHRFCALHMLHMIIFIVMTWWLPVYSAVIPDGTRCQPCMMDTRYSLHNQGDNNKRKDYKQRHMELKSSGESQVICYCSSQCHEHSKWPSTVLNSELFFWEKHTMVYTADICVHTPNIKNFTTPNSISDCPWYLSCF